MYHTRASVTGEALEDSTPVPVAFRGYAPRFLVSGIWFRVGGNPAPAVGIIIPRSIEKDATSAGRCTPPLKEGVRTQTQRGARYPGVVGDLE